MKLSSIASSAACLLLCSTSFAATIAHTWVSSTGNDGTCTGTTAKPCATFAQAVSLTTAGGLVSVLGPGDYGPLTITQSITIDGTGGGTIGFAGVGEGIYVNPSASVNVVLRNLHIDGAGTGSDAIFVASTGTTNIVNVLIDGCALSGFNQLGVGVGSESPMYVTVRNTSMQGGTVGVRTFQNGTVAPITNYDHVQLDHVTVQGATTAGVFTRNGNLDITESTIAGSIGTSINGIEADTYATVNVQSSMITSNTVGVCIFSTSKATLATTVTVADNTTNIEACGGTVTGAGGAGPAPKP